MIKIVNIIKWVCVIFGSFGAVFSAYMHVKMEKAATAVVPLEWVKEAPNDKVSAKDSKVVNNLDTVRY